MPGTSALAKRTPANNPADTRYPTVLGVLPSGVDDTAAIQAAINLAEARGGAEVRLQRSTFGAINHQIASSLVLPANTAIGFSAEPGAKLVATAAMSAMITKATGGQAVAGMQLHDLYVDAAHLALRCLDIDQATNFTIERSQFWNATTVIADFGRSGTNKVLDLRMRNVILRGVDGSTAGDSPTMMPSYGLRMGLLATDAIIEGVSIVNTKIGASDNVGGGTIYNKVHVFGFPYPTTGSTTSYVGTKGFEVLGGMCRFTDCYADTQLIGWDVQGVGNNIITNSLFYWPADLVSATPIVGFNVASPNNAINNTIMRLPSTSSLSGYPFQLQSTAVACSVTNSVIYGSTWTGMFNLVGGAAMPASSGNTWGSGTFPQSMDAGSGVIQGAQLGMYGAAGTARNLFWYTSSGSTLNRRFGLIVSTDAEVGSSQGSVLNLNSYLDNGNFGFSILQFQRQNGLAVYQRAILRTRQSITLSSAGAVTIDCVASNKWLINLQANCTSTTIGNASALAGSIQTGQELRITYAQDATGGRTYVWPTNCRFAGNVAPSDTTASRRTTVDFEYEGGVWIEVSRTVSVPTG